MMEKRTIFLMSLFLTGVTYFSYCMTKMIQAILDLFIEVIGN